MNWIETEFGSTLMDGDRIIASRVGAVLYDHSGTNGKGTTPRIVPAEIVLAIRKEAFEQAAAFMDGKGFARWANEIRKMGDANHG